jgi:hypothetical protein
MEGIGWYLDLWPLEVSYTEREREREVVFTHQPQHSLDSQNM